MNLWKVVIVAMAIFGIAGWLGFYAAGTPEPRSSPESESVASGTAGTVIGSVGSEAAKVRGEPDLTAVPADTTTPESARVAAARQKLAGLEVELERFELLINDIEARGDDPADYAATVMPEFRPLMNAFLDAQAELEAALTEQASAPAAASDGAL